MSSKRILGDSEDLPNAKRQLSTLEMVIEVEEEAKSNKRKVESLGAAADGSEPKSPKKSIERVVQPIEYVEILDDYVSSSSAVTIETEVVERPPFVTHVAKAPVAIQRIQVKPPKSAPTRVQSSSQEDDSIKPNAPLPPRASISAAVAESSEDRNIVMPTGLMSNNIAPRGDELHKLWSQFWVTIDTCISTVAPLFTTIILMLYLVSVVTKSQITASIGLVYVFVFIILMFSYFAAIVPFILISNAICSLLAPDEKIHQKDFVRLAVLISAIGLIVGYCKYGALAHPF